MAEGKFGGERQRRRSRAGVALVFVLWLMVLLSAVALEMAYRGHLRVQVTASTGESTKAFYLARSGIEVAMANLAESAKGDRAQETDRQDTEDQYRNVQLGEGSFTLYAGTDESGEPKYGLVDESAKLNINTVDVAILQKVPMLSPEMAGTIDNLRKQQPFQDLKDLLILDGMDNLMLLGEDQNENGLLDANENDGDETWPPDNSDGVLDAGLSAYLTTWSASRNLASDGQERVDINEADAEAITKAVGEIDTQHADSIVARREKGELSSVLDLLDVELVEKVEATPEQQGEQQNQPPQENQNQGQQKDAGKKEESKDESKDNKDNKDSKDEQGKMDSGEAVKQDEQKQQEQEQEQEKKSEEKPKYTYKSTGQKAFDQDTVRKIADRLTTSEDDVLQGLININTASAEVLACLPGLDETLAQAIVVARDGRVDGFKSTTDLLDVSGMSIDILKQFYGLVSARSDVYNARSIGVLRGGAIRANVTAVLDVTEDNVQIRYWQEHD